MARSGYSYKSGAAGGGRRSGGVGKIVPVLIILVIAAAAIFGPKFFRPGKAVAGFQKGVGYVTWSKDSYLTPGSDQSLAEIKELGADWVSILVTWYQTNIRSGDIQKTENTPSDEAVTHAIQEAHKLGLKVMLKLHLDLLDKSDASWRGEIGCLKEADWDEWFRKYTDYVMYYVDIANKEKAEMICIGTELSTVATVKGYLWREIIKKVRKNYSGLLTYAAHWDRYLDIRFWDMLDYIGINAYFPLTVKMVPTYEELKAEWTKWVEEIEAFQQKTGKPVLFPEAGCSSADGAAIRPWEHVSRREVNVKLQADFYRALLDVFWEKEWFYGLYWWCWGTNVHMGGEHNRGFTPQNKPAEQVVKEWYAKPDPR